MNIIHQNHKQGFTIIEVSLVLAIAGLIFLMIFVALPALQRQSRDAKRREDTLTLIGAIKKYQQNNRGALPEIEDNYYYVDNSWGSSSSKPFSSSNWGKFYIDYLGDNFANPENEKYDLIVLPCEDGESLLNGAQCTDHRNWFGNDSFDNRSSDWYIYTSATCQNDKPSKSSSPRNVAVIVQLESGTYCANT